MSTVDPFVVTVAPIPLAEFRERVLALYTPPLRSRGSYLQTRRLLDLLAALGTVATTADLTTATVARFVASRAGQENPNTTRTHLRKLSALCSIAVGEGWLRISPFAIRRSWVRPVTPKPPRVHSRAEIAAVLRKAAAEIAAAHPGQRWKARRLYALAATVAYTGLRKMEALTLMVEDVRLREGILCVVARVGLERKTDGAAQPVPIPGPLLPILRGWIGQLGRSGALFPNATGAGPWTGGPMGHTACDQLKALGARAGVPGLTFQSLRHGWATHAEFWGLTEAQIARVLRHTNTRTQRTYRHPELDNLRAMVRGVSYDGDAAAEPPAIAGPPRAVDPRAVPERGPAAAAPPPATPGMDPAMVDYRVIPGFPRHRLGSDRSVWTNLRRDGHEHPGDPPGPWRRLHVQRRGGREVVSLRRDGRSIQRTIAALWRDVFGESSNQAMDA